MATKLGERITNIALVVAASCCVLVTIRVFRNGPPSVRSAAPVREVRDWETYASGRHRIGRRDAPVTLTEFTDFQCPACRQAHGTIDQLVAKYPSQLQVVYRQFPLENIHPLARGVALGAECAADQGKFKIFHDLMFSAQDTIDRVSIEQAAHAAGVRDSVRFHACLSASATTERLERDLAAGRALGVRGTPTFLVNSQVFSGAPPFSYLDSVIKAALRYSANGAR